MRVLVTRPEPDAVATAARLEAAGHVAVRDPLLIIEPMISELPPGPFHAVVLTSVNGARALALHPQLSTLQALPLYAVGRRTAAAVPSGFRRVSVAGGNGEALVALLQQEMPPGARLLHVCGEDRAVDLEAELRGNSISVDLLVIYRARAADRLSPETVDALRGRQIDAAFHFSPRTAATLVALAGAAGVSADGARIVHLCFSANVAAPLAAAGWPTRVAAKPTEEALFALLSV
jgi:uroporphyrinogen-III synthase